MSVFSHMKATAKCLLDGVAWFLSVSHVPVRVDFIVRSSPLEESSIVMAVPAVWERQGGDPVVAFAPVEKFMKALPSGELELVADSEDPHNITGRAKSPSTVDRFVRQIVGFLMTKLKLSVPAESALRNVARKVDVRPAWPASS
eukprot:TRINITY_DN31857_c0_g1_i4.p1 TRINITY_DN31857_c0_g1~~TRINITY_DN31857_c0_g1_i4.p1  ORF type:complete len:144 (-),score=22.71 TRINITY_DN31857_c0_g1_i4:60-491(-)